MSNKGLPKFCAAYNGKKPYIFISYAHVDGDRVYPEINALHDRGYRVWYDEGIAPTDEWLKKIALAIDGSAIFIVFITKDAIQSYYVNKEVKYAINKRKLILPVYLEEVSLPNDWELIIGDIQAILKWKMSGDDFLWEIMEILPDDCLIKSEQASAQNVNITYSNEPENITKTKNPRKAEIPSPVLPLKPEKPVSVKRKGLNNPKLILATISALILLSVVFWTVNKLATITKPPSQNEISALQTDEESKPTNSITITPSQTKTTVFQTDKEPNSTTPTQAIIKFHSSLTLWGTIKNQTAIVSLDPQSNASASVVKVGDVIEGETIISIDKYYIVVKNQTGQGKVEM